MEFVEFIKSPRIEKVSLRRRGRAYLEGTLCVTGHHLIFSSRTDHKDELIVSQFSIVRLVYSRFTLNLKEFANHTFALSMLCWSDDVLVMESFRRE